MLCCCPPPNNTFERRVFTTPSVQAYVVLVPDDEASAGDWTAYRAHTTFTMTEDPRLGASILPHGGKVLIFTRTAA